MSKPMTDEALRSLCQYVMHDYPTVNACHKVAEAALKLLAERDVMRDWLINAKNQAEHDGLPGLVTAIENMLVNLTPASRGGKA